MFKHIKIIFNRKASFLSSYLNLTFAFKHIKVIFKEKYQPFEVLLVVVRHFEMRYTVKTLSLFQKANFILFATALEWRSFCGKVISGLNSPHLFFLYY